MVSLALCSRTQRNPPRTTLSALVLLCMRDSDSGTAAPPVAVLGLLWAAVGVVAFSMTFPATALALRGFDPVLVGAGRTVLAALLAGGSLLLRRPPLPSRTQFRALVNVAVGCGLGFGVLTAIALQQVSASHAAVVGALLPVTTACVAVLRAGERPAPLFWLATGGGAAAVAVFALHHGAGALTPADGLLVIALLVGGLGYAEGGRLARDIPGWQVVSWGVILALPAAIPLTAAAAVLHPPHPTAVSVLGLLYVASVSMFLGFFAWYRGLATAGIARASQLQLAQPFLTLALSALLLGEHPGVDALLAAAVVILCVVGTQRARVRRVDAPRALAPGYPTGMSAGPT